MEILFKKELNQYVYIFSGSNDDIEGSINLTNRNISYSKSYNTYILNVYFNDDSACTLRFFSKDNYKQYYRIKKFFEDDDIL